MWYFAYLFLKIVTSSLHVFLVCLETTFRHEIFFSLTGAQGSLLSVNLSICSSWNTLTAFFLISLSLILPHLSLSTLSISALLHLSYVTLIHLIFHSALYPSAQNSKHTWEDIWSLKLCVLISSTSCSEDNSSVQKDSHHTERQQNHYGVFPGDSFIG